MPHDLSLSSEELLLTLNFGEISAGCPAGKGIGRQMVNASEQSWESILAAMKGKRVPVIWCGKTHKFGRGSIQGNTFLPIWDFSYPMIAITTCC